MGQLTRIRKTDTDIAAQAKAFGYATSEEAEWTCAECGETPPPKYLQTLNRHIRASCRCQREAMEKQKRFERERMERQIRMEQLRQCYGWYGKQFSSEEMAARTFETFRDGFQDHAVNVACDWSCQPTGTLLFHGEYGTGKTHLAAALCNVLRERGRKCRWITAPKLFQGISALMDEARRSAVYGDYVGSWTDIARKAATADILFLDDVDKLKGSEWREEVYHSILDDRVNAGRPTVITINNLHRLAECMGESVADRLYIGRITVEFEGESYRKRLAVS